MTQEEYDADIASAKLEGAQELERLVGKMHELGLGLAAISGALTGHLSYLDELAAVARSEAAASRQKPVEGVEPPSGELPHD